MDAQNMSMGRGMFGYRSKDVERVLADRATLLNMAAQRAQAAEARAAQLEQVAAHVAEMQTQVAQRDETVARIQAEMAQREAQLAQVQADGARKDEAIARLQAESADRDHSLTALQASEQQLHAEIAELQQRLEDESANRDVLARDLMRELGPIIAAAEDSARRIHDRAEAESSLKLSDAARTAREAQANLARLTAWHDQLGAVLEAVQNSVNAAQREIQSVPQRISEALRPMIDGMDTVSSGLDELSRTSLPERVIDQLPARREPEPAAERSEPQLERATEPQPEPAYAREPDHPVYIREGEQQPYTADTPPEQPAYAREPEPAEAADHELSSHEPERPPYSPDPEPARETEPESPWTVPSHWTDDPR